jgi:hypothetical protein
MLGDIPNIVRDSRDRKKPPYKFIKFIQLFRFISLGYELVVFDKFIKFIKFILMSTLYNSGQFASRLPLIMFMLLRKNTDPSTAPPQQAKRGLPPQIAQRRRNSGSPGVGDPVALGISPADSHPSNPKSGSLGTPRLPLRSRLLNGSTCTKCTMCTRPVFLAA